MNGNTEPDPERKLAPVITWRSTLVTSVDCSTCKLVALVLSLYMNERGGSAFPSNARLADDCSLGVSTVREHLNTHLHAQGWLTLIERGGTRSGVAKANEWQASTPRQELAGPRQETADPRQLTPGPPPATGPQVVQDQVHEVVGRQERICVRCGEVLPDLTAYQDHLEVCDEEMMPAADLKVVS